MIVSLNKISFKLILFSVMLIPLTVSDHNLVLNLGEYRNETYIYPLLLAVFCFLFSVALTRKISIPIKSILFSIILLFVIWCLFTFLFSLNSISQNEFKGTNGLMRFIKQFSSLVFSVILVPITLYNVFIKYKFEVLFKKLEKIVNRSLVVVFIFGMLAVFSVIFNNELAHAIIQWINNVIPIIEIREDFILQRISSISHEPPFLGMFLIFVIPWVLKGLLYKENRKKYAIYLVMVLILMYVSKSRAAQLFGLIQILSFFTLLFFSKKKVIVNTIKGFVLVVAILPFIFLWKGKIIVNAVEERIDSFNIVKNLETNNSNKTRTGTIIAGLKTFSENPILGVGYGQQGYYLIDRYPDWSVKGNWEIERYLTGKQENYPPGFNLYVRLLAETGLVGFLIFMMFVFLLVYIPIKKYFIRGDVFYLFFVTNFIGFIINWMQIDTPRLYGFWVVFILFLIYSKQKYNGAERLNNSNTSL